MSFHIQFTIPVKPKPKQSTRIATSWRSGKKKLWTHRDPGMTAYEKIIGSAARKAMKDHGYKEPTGGPVSLLARFYMPIAKNRVKTLSDGDQHCQRPDLDNLLKGLLDGLKPLWTDDCLVAVIEASKLWGNTAKIQVEAKGI